MKKANEVHKPEGKVFLISDTHFDHENIIKYCSRPFKSKDEMNKTIIDNWNSVVGFRHCIHSWRCDIRAS